MTDDPEDEAATSWRPHLRAIAALVAAVLFILFLAWWRATP
jgi:hypothetical protein